MDWERQPGHMLPLSIKRSLLLWWPAFCHPKQSWTAREWGAPSVEKHGRGRFSCTVNSDPQKSQTQTSKERSQILRLCRVPGRSSRSSWRWWSRSSKNRCSGTRGNHPSCWWRLWGPSQWPEQVERCSRQAESGTDKEPQLETLVIHTWIFTSLQLMISTMPTTWSNTRPVFLQLSERNMHS